MGEVWLCSGQSNMQFRVNQAINAKYEIHRANNPLIRQLAVPNKLSFHPEAIYRFGAMGLINSANHR